MKTKEFSSIFLVQFAFVCFIVIYNVCGMDISNSMASSNYNSIINIFYTLFFMCVGYSSYMSLEQSSDPTFSILLRAAFYGIICFIFRADLVFMYAITYMLICGFCFYANIHKLLAGLAFVFGLTGIIDNSILFFGFLFVYTGMWFAKERKSLKYIPLANFIIPIFTIVLLDSLFWRFVIEKEKPSISISTFGIGIILFLIITCVHFYGTGRKISVLNISSAYSFFLYEYEAKIFSFITSPIYLAIFIIVTNTLIAYLTFKFAYKLYILTKSSLLYNVE